MASRLKNDRAHGQPTRLIPTHQASAMIPLLPISVPNSRPHSVSMIV
ncbi:hypothetical protein [Streptomyces sp. BE133]|nr:hypothetical protein [Streptomyces sp. BE133]MEE1806077.1 hypothetical protein [Streptomyces sp. BE133]